MVVGNAAGVGVVLVELLESVSVLLVAVVDDLTIPLLEAVSGFAATVRREVLVAIVSSERTTREELAARLTDDDAVPIADARRLEVALHHNHLPRLADEGYVEYDPRTGDVVRWSDPGAIESALESP